jgi:hypothetical protein
LPTRGTCHWGLSRALDEAQRRLAQPQHHGSPDVDAAAALLTLCCLAGHGDLPAALRPLLAERAVPAAVPFWKVRSAQRTWIGSRLQSMPGGGSWELLPLVIPTRRLYLSDLGIALQDRFERNGSSADLDETIRIGQAAVDPTPAGDLNGLA